MEKAKRKEKEFCFRRSEILSEAEKIFAAKGFFSTTVADIAQASGYAVGTLYQFFPSKEDLYMTMVVEKMDRMYGDMQAAVVNHQTNLEKLRAVILSYFQFVENNLDFCNLFLRNDTAGISAGQATLWDRIVAEHIKHTKLLEDSIRQGMADREIIPGDTIILSFALSGMIRGVIFSWMLSERKFPLADQAPRLLEVFLNGVGVRQE